MPRLPDSTVQSPLAAARLGGDALTQPRRWPPPYPGVPVGLEMLSARERGWWGHRFGIDTPYLWAPSGWGEQVPLYGDTFGVDPANIIVGRNGPLQP